MALKVVILAAGKGVRMSAVYPGIPKPMIPVGNIPMLIRLLMTIESLNIDFNNIFVVVGKDLTPLFKKETARYLGKCPVFVEQDESYGYGTGAAIQAFLFNIVDLKEDDEVLILNGDAPFLLKESIRRMQMEKLLFGYDLLVGTGFVKDPSGYGRIRFERTGKLVILEEKELNGFQTNHVNGGIYLVSARLLDRALEIRECNSTKEKKITDLLLFSTCLGIYSDLDSIEILNINTPFDKTFAEFILSK